MRLWHANLGRGVSVGEFKRNVVRILVAAGPRAVLAFQEIDEADVPEELEFLEGMTRRTHVLMGRRTAVPILVPHHIEITSALVTPACKGLAGFTPNRVVNEVTLRLGPNLEATVLNTHLPILRAQTITRRRKVRQELKARTREYDAGVWVADTNTHIGWPRIAKRERVVTDAGIDKAKAWAPRDRRVIVKDRRTINLTIDGHNAHGARIIWKKA